MPELTVVIITQKDREEIACLPPLYESEYSDFEIVISRTDGVGRARNAGIEAASSGKLVFLDDDSRPQPGYLPLAATLLEKYPLVSGRVIHPEDDLFADIAANRGYDHGTRPKFVGTLVGCNMLMRKEVFDVVGQFNENIAWGHVETLFAERALEEFEIYYHPDLVVEHRFGGSILEWWEKQWRYGRADVQAAKLQDASVFAWHDAVPIGGGSSITQIIVKSIGKNLRNLSRLVVLFKETASK